MHLTLPSPSGEVLIAGKYVSALENASYFGNKVDIQYTIMTSAKLSDIVNKYEDSTSGETLQMCYPRKQS